MSNSRIDYRLLRRVTGSDFEALRRLYLVAGWMTEEESGDFIKTVVSGSAIFYAAFDGEEPIGMGRAVGDGSSDAYIQDIAVLPSHRRRGIGGEIVRRIVAELKVRGYGWIGLVGEPGTESFYRELGFAEKPGHTLWILP